MRTTRIEIQRALSSIACLAVVVQAAPVYAQRSIADDKFRQLEEILPTPNTYRTASGAPGHQYWQQAWQAY